MDTTTTIDGTGAIDGQTGPAALRATDLTITYRGAERPALDGLSFDLPPGRTLLVVGPSGSGKSTLALAIAGLIPRDVPATVSGSLRLDDVDIASMARPSVSTKVGIVFQDPTAQLVMERVEDDVAFGLEQRGWPVEAMRRRVPEALAEVGLDGLERRRSRRLSGGQQQRLALAGVVAAMPGLLVLDEPTANLDPVGAGAFLGRLAGLRAHRSTTIVLIEHRVEEAWPLADLVLALDRAGRTIDVGPPAEVAARSAVVMDDAGIWLPAAVDGSMARRRRARPRPQPAQPTPALIDARGVTFAYGQDQPVIMDVSLSIAAGERVALVGPNGGGKSTLARLLVGLLRPDAGSIVLCGGDPVRLRADELSRRAAFVFQEPERQFLTALVRDEVLLGLDPERHEAATALMDRLGLPLDRFGGRNPFRLSGGEARRLSLAVALVHDPAVLVLDEPTFGQDRRTYQGLLDILDEHLDAGTTLIAATHDPRFVADVATRVVTITAGRVTADESA